MDDGLSSSDEGGQNAERPYNELLHLLHANPDKGPTRKKRKITADASISEEAEPAQAEVPQGENVLQAQAPSDDEETQEVDDEGDDIGPFEKHVNIPDGSKLCKKIESIKLNKWASVRKELADGLRLAHTTPDQGETGSTPVLPAMKSTSNLKVG